MKLRDDKSTCGSDDVSPTATCGRPIRSHRTICVDSCGAVYVEFLIAFLPFLTFFLCLWQVSILYYTKIIVDNAAFAAARAAAVIVAENANRVDPSGGPTSVNQLTPSRDDYVRTAAEIALAPLILDGTILTVDVKYPTPDQPGSDDAMRGKTYPGMGNSSVSLMRVRVETIMNCKIGLANAILCPADTLLGLFTKQFGLFVLPVRSEAVFPYQGARYTYNPKDDSGRAGTDALAGWSSMCFAAGTLVDTAEGFPLPIEQLREGDLVMSRDEANGETGVEHVVRTFVTPDQPVVELRLRESDPIRVTPGHRFATNDRGWTAAQDLIPGESLATENGDDLHVDGVVSVAAHETVFNLEVERTHTYFVGRAATWVHNANCTTPIPGFGSGLPGGGGGGGGKGGSSSGGGSGSGNGPSRRYPGQTCENDVLDALQSAIHPACDTGTSCSTTKYSKAQLAKVTCSDARSRLQSRNGCLASRVKVQSTCFAGSPEAGHDAQIATVQTSIGYCQNLVDKNCAPGNPMAGL